MIKIRNSEELENNFCELFDKDDNLVGKITTGLSLTDVCLQIKEQKLEGYYLLQNGEKSEIRSDGRVVENSKFFPLLGSILRKLI